MKVPQGSSPERLVRLGRTARLGLAGLVLVVLVVIAYYNVPGRVTGDALLMSMHRNSVASIIICTRSGVGEDRSCQFVVGGDSAGMRYAVIVTGHCWTASRVEEDPPSEGEYAPHTPQPARYRGCVVVGDNLRPFGRLLYGSGHHDVRPHPSSSAAS